VRTRALAAAALAGLAVGIAAFALLPGESSDSASPRAQAADPGRAAFAAVGCGSCHTFTPAGATGTIGPNLDQALAGATAESVKRTIVDPPESIMPQDFGRRLTPAQLDALAAFLTRR
jgi:mono/diheme cytochrome c family protein